MESLPKLYHSHLPLNHRRSSFPKTPFSSLPPTPLPSSSSIKASSSSSPPPSHKPQNPVTYFLQTLNPIFSPLIKPTCIAIAATAFFFTRLHLNPAGAGADPLPPPPDSAASETLPNEQNGSAALRSLLESNIKSRKIDEAIRVVERLVDLEAEELEWPLLKAHLHMRNGDHELASSEFEHVLKNDPFNVEGYRGLLMATSELNKPTVGLLKRIEEMVRVCEEEKRDFDVRDFKLLIAQIKVIDGDLYGALKVYEEIVKEQPKDFRPYLCQGIVYTMLRKKDEAEKQFEKYRTLVPENHPSKEYFDDNTRVFSRNS
ncbi:hypothetical protein RJT34_24483 [Clitoria ternatea]|uniref:Uncharacterized protein n=1 Tax=Clitoria ternatea TaxID=43366 RepID=A0AAN9IJ93_CLITE